MLKPPARRSVANYSVASITNQIQQILQTPLMSVIYLIGAIVCLFGGKGFLALMLFASCIYSNPVMIWKLQHQYRDIFQTHKLNIVMFTGVVLGLFSGVILGLAFVEPSHAQFFNNAQTFVKANFAGTGASVTKAVDLVMNTLRMLFVMYVLFGIVQVFQAVRQGEEWKDLAKTPFFVVLAGTLGDVLVGAITGTTSTPTP